MKSKRAFTLIELMVVIFISSILSMIMIKVAVSCSEQYILTMEEMVKKDQIDNAMLNIENIFNRTCITEINASEEEESINATYVLEYNTSNYRKKTVKLKSGKIVVRTVNKDSNGITEGENIILKNVSEFNVIKKENLIYYEIVMDNGEKRIRCL